MQVYRRAKRPLAAMIKYRSLSVHALAKSRQYFAVASLNSTEGVRDLTDKVRLLIIAEAWLELAQQTTLGMRSGSSG